MNITPFAFIAHMEGLIKEAAIQKPWFNGQLYIHRSLNILQNKVSLYCCIREEEDEKLAAAVCIEGIPAAEEALIVFKGDLQVIEPARSKEIFVLLDNFDDLKQEATKATGLLLSLWTGTPLNLENKFSQDKELLASETKPTLSEEKSQQQEGSSALLDESHKGVDNSLNIQSKSEEPLEEVPSESKQEDPPLEMEQTVESDIADTTKDTE